MNQFFIPGIASFLIMISVSFATAQDDATATDDKPDKQPPVEVSVAEGNIKMMVPAVWKKIKPKINFIEAEFQIAPVEGDKNKGRLTVMAAGGSVQQKLL